MAILGGFDVHRAQITFDYVDTQSGEVTTGQIRPATRPVLRQWLARFHARHDVAMAVEGCTGWRFVVEELVRAGVEPHLASRPTRPASADGSGAPRPIGPTLVYCASCWSSAACPSRGSRPATSSRCAAWLACTSR
jgi:transposase